MRYFNISMRHFMSHMVVQIFAQRFLHPLIDALEVHLRKRVISWRTGRHLDLLIILYVIPMYLSVTWMLFVGDFYAIRVSFLFHLYVLVWHSHDTRMWLIYQSYVIHIQSYFICIYSNIIEERKSIKKFYFWKYLFL